MTRFASSERQGLCDTFKRVGPDTPTLCSPWLTRDLAAHLVVRERRPDVAPAIWLPMALLIVANESAPTPLMFGKALVWVLALLLLH